MNNSIGPNSEEVLCTQCGLCCSAFHSVGHVANEEEEKIVAQFGGDIIVSSEGKKQFRQPCPAFNGKCSIWPRHPLSCKGYRCGLLDSLSAGEISLLEAIGVVLLVRNAVDNLESLLGPIIGQRAETVEEYVARSGLVSLKSRSEVENQCLRWYLKYKAYRAKYFD